MPSQPKKKAMTAEKKVSGIKIHIGTDTCSLPNAIHVTTANITDRAGALEMLEKVVEVAKRNELHTFAVIPKRWAVERAFAWLDHCRRLWKNCERKLHNTQQMVTLAFISVLLNRY